MQKIVSAFITSRQENKENLEALINEKVLRRYDELFKMLMNQNQNQRLYGRQAGAIHEDRSGHFNLDSDNYSETVEMRDERSPVKVVNKVQKPQVNKIFSK